QGAHLFAPSYDAMLPPLRTQTAAGSGVDDLLSEPLRFVSLPACAAFLRRLEVVQTLGWREMGPGEGYTMPPLPRVARAADVVTAALAAAAAAAGSGGGSSSSAQPGAA